MERKFFIVLLAAVLLGVQGAAAFETTQGKPGLGGPSSYRKAEMGKADYHLFKTFAEYRNFVKRQPGGVFRPGNPLVRFSHGKVLVDAFTAGSPETMLADLKGLGFGRASHYRSAVSGWLPLGMVKKAAALDSVRSISASLRPIASSGLVTSGGDPAMYADVARSVFGADGSGVTVGVLSDSFDAWSQAVTHAADDIASDDLPADLYIIDDTAGGNDEGRAIMQIVHDVAPGARLAFHTAFNGMADFADGIVELADSGSDVIVDDILYIAEPMFEDGLIAQAVDEVHSNGVAYFSSAGNQARNSYEADFTPSNELLMVDGDNRGMLHDFDPAPDVVDWLQEIFIPADAQLIMALQWDSPFGASQNDVDIYLVDDNMVVWAEGISNNLSTGEPVEILQFTNIMGIFGTRFHLLITHFNPEATPAPGKIKYILFNSGGITVNEHQTFSSTIYGHANAGGAEAVGAAFYQETPAFGQSPPLLEYYSSAGGTPILFDLAGDSIFDLRVKPEIVAPDGGNTTFFYSDTTRDEDSLPNFFGTSAAAPHAAGVAALLLSLDPALMPGEIYANLENNAVDMEGAGADYDSGYGLIRADLSLAALGNTPSPPPPQEPVPPVAGFSYSCSGTVCSFDGSVSSDDGIIVTYDWDFGDGNTMTTVGALAVHEYATPGSYSVGLTVTDNGGYMDTTTVSFRVKKNGVSEGDSSGTTGDSGGGGGGDFCTRHPDHAKCR